MNTIKFALQEFSNVRKSEHYLDGKVCFIPCGEKVTTFADGQGHNGSIKRVFVDYGGEIWYQMDFPHDADDKKVLTVNYVGI